MRPISTAASSPRNGSRDGSASPTTTCRPKKLGTVIDTPKDPFRDYLTGPLGRAAVRAASPAARTSATSMPRFTSFTTSSSKRRWRSSANARTSSWPTAASRRKARIRTPTPASALTGKIDLHDRMIARARWGTTSSWSSATAGKPALGVDRKPELDEDRAVHSGEQLGPDRRSDAGRRIREAVGSAAATPATRLLTTLKTATPSHATEKSGSTHGALWFTPTVGQVDLKEASKIILVPSRRSCF